MKIFPISIPRTRSSFLYESLRGYYKHVYNMPQPWGHPEIFLDWGRNMELVDRKVEVSHTTEIYPVSHKNEMKVHFIYPPVFDNRYDRNVYKLNVLQQEKDLGREYYIKGTLNIAPNMKEICDFYSDREIIFTTRDDKEKLYMSLMYAWTTKLFHARQNNLDLYKSRMDEGIVVDLEDTRKTVEFINQNEIILDYLKDNNIKHTVVTYEQLENENVISDVLGTDDWIQYREEDIPIHIEKNYRTLIKNYDDVLAVLREVDAF